MEQLNRRREEARAESEEGQEGRTEDEEAKTRAWPFPKRRRAYWR